MAWLIGITFSEKSGAGLNTTARYSGCVADKPNEEQIEYLPLSEVAKQMGFACDRHVRAARETVPLVLDADAQGLADFEILKRLTDWGIPSDDAQETLQHVRDAVQLVSL